MTAAQLTIDITFEPRILAGVLKTCTEVLERAAERVERLEAQARIDADERRQLRDRLKLKDERIADLEEAIALCESKACVVRFRDL